MKRFLLLFLLLLLGSYGARAAVSVAQYNPTNLFTIGYRSDGIAGRGTVTDPFDGSTSNKLDTLLNNAPINADIYILPSTNVYLTGGSYGWHIKSGQRLRGGGLGATTLRLIASTNCWTVDGQPGVTNTEVCDLTIDCNFQGNSATNSCNNGALAGVNLLSWGGCAIRRVHVINAGTTNAGAECFPISFSSATNSVKGPGVVEGCIVDQYRGGNCTAIVVGIGTNTYQCIGARVVNNTVTLDTTKPGLQNCYGSAGVSDFLFSGNHAFGGSFGYVHDTGQGTNITISGNSFSNDGNPGSTYGIYFNVAVGVSDISDLAIVNNSFRIGSVGSGITFGRVSGAGSPVRNVNISGNRFNTFTSTNAGSSAWNLQYTTGLRVINNLVQSTLTAGYVSCTNVVAFLVHDEAGANVSAEGGITASNFTARGSVTVGGASVGTGVLSLQGVTSGAHIETVRDAGWTNKFVWSLGAAPSASDILSIFSVSALLGTNIFTITNATPASGGNTFNANQFDSSGTIDFLSGALVTNLIHYLTFEARGAGITNTGFLSQAGPVTNWATVRTKGAATNESTTRLVGAVTAEATLDVTGASTFGGTLTATNGINGQSALNITGAAGFGGTVTATNAATVGTTLTTSNFVVKGSILQTSYLPALADLDWVRSYYGPVVLTVNSNFTMSNIAADQGITVQFTNSGLFTASFPTYVYWPGTFNNTAPALESNSVSILRFEKIGSTGLTNGYVLASKQRQIDMSLSTNGAAGQSGVLVLTNSTISVTVFPAAGSGTVTASGGSLTANSVVLGAGTTDTKVVAGIVTDGTSKLTLGVAGTSVGSIDFKNATSGTATVAPVTGALGAVTLSLPALTGTFILDTSAALLNKQTGSSVLSNLVGTVANNVTNVGQGWGIQTSTTTGTLTVNATNALSLMASNAVTFQADYTGGSPIVQSADYMRTNVTIYPTNLIVGRVMTFKLRGDLNAVDRTVTVATNGLTGNWPIHWAYYPGTNGSTAFTVTNNIGAELSLTVYSNAISAAYAHFR